MTSPCRHFVLLLFCSFVFVDTGSAQQTWQKYNLNPILGSAQGFDYDNPVYFYKAFEPSVIFDSSANIYRMWFASQSYMNLCISDAISEDGKEWFVRAHSPVFKGGLSWDQQVRAPKVIFDGKEYKMYYTGQITANDYHIGLATSSDGKLWQRVSSYPVLDPPPGKWDSNNQEFCDVLYEDSTYYMWFDGGDGVRGAIGLATSKDGISWTEYPDNPVFQHSESGWDSLVVSSPAIVRVNGVLYMFYLGSSAPGVTFSIGWAHSTDGINWTRAASNPVLSTSGWEGPSFGYHSVLFRGEKFHMWYTALSVSGQWLTGYAYSDFVPLSVEKEQHQPVQYRLLQNYPNPFNPSTTIAMEIPSTSKVKVSIYDVLGPEVTTLFEGEKSPGKYDLTFNAQQVSSGIYYCRMVAESVAGGNRVERTTKLIVLK